MSISRSRDVPFLAAQVDLSDYWDYTDALQQLDRFLNEVYQYKRIHSSLGYLIPAEFEQHEMMELEQERK